MEVLNDKFAEPVDVEEPYSENNYYRTPLRMGGVGEVGQKDRE